MTDDSRDVQRDPEVLEGEDDVPRMPASPVDPFTPELHARAGEDRAFSVLRLAWIPIVIVVIAIVIWAVTR
jgi:hypothetical protein